LGSRGAETGKKLWEGIEKETVKSVKSDDWKAYKGFIPKEVHTQSKAEAYTVEGYNSFRHFLARLIRQSKCYTKNMQMLQYSVMLLMLKWNGTLEAIIH